jgi:O-antigen/teichoic acid export membrane protein
VQGKLFRSEFTKNIFTLASGTAVAQAVTLVISPVLSRIYTPEDFGMFAFYMSIVAAFTLIATFRYEMAVMIPKEEASSVTIIYLSLLIDFLLCIFLLIVIIILGLAIPTNFPINKLLRIWLYILPVMVFFQGSSNVFQHWFNRQKRYRILAHAKIINSTGTNGFTLLLGLIGAGTWGLFIGNLFGIFIFNLFFIYKIYWLDREKFKHFNKTEIVPLAKKHKDLPLANTPQAFLEMLQMNGIIYLLQIFFNSMTIGLYSFAMRILQAPMWLIVTSVAQVFYKEASENYQMGMDITKTVKKTMKMTAIVGLPALISLVIAGPALFSFVFGKQWSEAGVYARILAPWLYFDFIRYSVAQTTLIVNKIRPMFFFSIIGNIIVILSLVTGGYFFNDVKIAFVFLSAFMVMYDIGIIFWILRIIKEPRQ